MNANYDECKKELKRKISELSPNGDFQKICIFGAGQRGLKLYKELSARFIDIDFFCDNNKSGESIDKIRIIPFTELKEIKDTTVVIISAVDCSGIKNQLSENEFPFVYLMDDIVKLYCDIPPIKWLEEFDSQVDYTSEETQKLIGVLKKTILDICDYYEKLPATK